MDTRNGRLRVVQWNTGNVGRQAVASLAGDPRFEIVGCFAHSEDKVGRDIGEICGIDPIGVSATNDVAALLALRPDCVIYTPLHLNVPELANILRAGCNVVTSAEFLTGTGIGRLDRERLRVATAEGEVTLFGSGMNPGWAQLAAGVISGIVREIRHVKIIESFDLSAFADDPNMDELPFGLPGDAPDLVERAKASTLVFGDGVDVLAGLLGVEDYDVRCTADFALATEELDLPGGPIAEGHVAGIDLRWEAVVAGAPIIELHQRWVMGRKIEPKMRADMAYLIEIAGDPQVNVRIDLLPDTQATEEITLAYLQRIGMKITAQPLVNAIPLVVSAQPGIATYADLPGVVSGRLHVG